MRAVFVALLAVAANGLAPVGRAKLLKTCGAAAAGALLAPRAAVAADAAVAQAVLVKYGTDATGKALATAKFSVPDAWTKLSGADVGGRSMSLYADPKNADTNAFVLITPVRGDYTSLGSFGNLETVQDTVMPAADGVSYQLIESKAEKGAYRYEYTVQVPDQPLRHLTSIFAVDSDSIVTFNFQAKADDYDKDVAALAKAVVATFKLGKV